METLTRRPGSFTDEALAGLETDLPSSADVDGRELLFYFLVEHQSSVDATMAWRVWRYVTRVLGSLRRAFQGEAAAALGGADRRLPGRAEVDGGPIGRELIDVDELAVKFGAPSKSFEARVAAASLEETDRWAERILTATTVDEVFDSQPAAAFLPWASAD